MDRELDDILGDDLALRRNLKGLIERGGKGINAIEREAGIGHGVLAQFLRGKTDRLAVDVLQRLAPALDATVGELLGEAARGATPTVPWAALLPDPRNPRKHFDSEGLAQLADSIQRHGLLHPLTVRPLALDEKAPANLRLPAGVEPRLIVAGERRWRAIGLLVQRGVYDPDHPVAVTVIEERPGENTARVIALLENLQRVDLSPLEEAEAFDALHRRHGWSLQRIAETVGKTDRFVQLRVKLLELTPALRQALDHGEEHPEGISLTQARAIAKANPTEQAELLRRVLAEELVTEHQITEAAKALGRAHVAREAGQGALNLGGGLAPVGSLDGSAAERRAEAGARGDAEREAGETPDLPSAPVPKARTVAAELVALAPFTLPADLFERLAKATRPQLGPAKADDTLWLAAATGKARLQLAPNSQVGGWVVTSYFDAEGAWIGSASVTPKAFARTVAAMLDAGLAPWRPDPAEIPTPDRPADDGAESDLAEADDAEGDDAGGGAGLRDAGVEAARAHLEGLWDAGVEAARAHLAQLKALRLDSLSGLDSRLLLGKALRLAEALLRCRACDTAAAFEAAEAENLAARGDLVEGFLAAARRQEAADQARAGES